MRHDIAARLPDSGPGSPYRMLRNSMGFYTSKRPWVSRSFFEALIDDLTDYIMAEQTASGVLPPWPFPVTDHPERDT